MTHLIMSGQVKPLTPVKLAFAGMLIGRLQRDGEMWIRASIAARLIAVPELAVHNYAGCDGWRCIWESVRLKDGRVALRKFYAEADVKRTAQRLKNGGKTERPRARELDEPLSAPGGRFF
ncbi:hypothetical protein [Bradyrhizobium yuanmingense]|uniref:hypothetical protein n=1 Tax=Bradyrhizobium yuanmingense TaxID=108015 RepID=UPI0023B907EF|nr:hypothetical protein [Bradyrhizobium yuanmingense]MDF0584727.1 hypothetical protein [Bradyrhizobium yuanmingense]